MGSCCATLIKVSLDLKRHEQSLCLAKRVAWPPHPQRLDWCFFDVNCVLALNLFFTCCFTWTQGPRPNSPCPLADALLLHHDNPEARWGAVSKGTALATNAATDPVSRPGDRILATQNLKACMEARWAAPAGGFYRKSAPEGRN